MVAVGASLSRRGDTDTVASASGAPVLERVTLPRITVVASAEGATVSRGGRVCAVPPATSALASIAPPRSQTAVPPPDLTSVTVSFV